MMAGINLVAFFAWWGAWITSRRLVFLALAIAFAGLACNLFAESLLIGWLPNRIDTIAPLASLLSGGAANGLYTFAGTAHARHPHIARRTPHFGMGSLDKRPCPDDLYHLRVGCRHGDFDRRSDDVTLPVGCSVRMETHLRRTQGAPRASIKCLNRPNQDRREVKRAA